MVTTGCPWLQPVVHGYHKLSVVITGCPWLPPVVHGYHWCHGYRLQVSMDTHADAVKYERGVRQACQACCF